MRWFKHSVASHDDPDIYGAREKFGDAGYLVFFIILEIYADEYHHKTNGEVSYNLALLCQKLRKRWVKAELILNYYATKGRIIFRTAGDTIYLQIPKFEEFKDNWSKRKTPQNSVVTTEQLPNDKEVRSKNKEADKEKEVKKGACAPDTPEQQNPSPEAKPRKKKTFERESQPYRLAWYLIQLLDERGYEWPLGKKPDIQTWALHTDYMLRLDKRNTQRIKDVMRWSQKDPFWRKNILSSKKLREQWGSLTENMKAAHAWRDDSEIAEEAAAIASEIRSSLPERAVP